MSQPSPTSFCIRRMSPLLHAFLKARAKRNDSSMQDEIISILEAARAHEYEHALEIPSLSGLKTRALQAALQRIY